MNGQEGTPPVGDPGTNPPAPAADPNTPSTGTPPTPQAGDGNDDPQSQMTLEAARKLRSEAANLRQRLKAFEDAEAKAKDEQLTATQRLEKQLAEAKTQHDSYTQAMQERFIKQQIALDAARLGVIDPEDAAKLLDWASLEFDDDGVPTNTSKLLAALIKDKPYLVGKAPQMRTAGGATNPARSATGDNTPFSWESIGALTQAEYAAMPPQRKEQMQAWMSRNRRGI